MPIDITPVQSKLIAISFLDDAAQQKVQGAWSRRFLEQQAILLQIRPQQSFEAVCDQLVELLNRHHTTVAVNTQFILAAFFHLESAALNDQVEILTQLVEWLPRNLNAQLSRVVQFGYVGVLGKLSAEEKAQCKAGAQLVKEVFQASCKFHSYHLFLVAESILERDRKYAWQGVAVLLELLRRGNGGLLPNGQGGQLGFLRYGYHSRTRFEQLQVRREKLSRRLSRDGAEEFQESMRRKALEAEQQALEHFRPNGRRQPVHPDMLVERGAFGCKQKKAAKGKLASYNAAQQYTVSAVCKTAARLEQDVEQYIREQLPADAPSLAALIDESDLGVQVLQDSARMKACFQQELLTKNRPFLSFLRYQPEGPWEEIEMFLVNTVQYAANRAVDGWWSEMQAVYGHTPMERWSDRFTALQREMTEVQGEIKNAVNLEEFVRGVQSSGARLQSNFSPILPGGQSTLCFLTSSAQEAQALPAYINAGTLAYVIDPQQGGVATSEPGVVHALQLVSFDQSDARLDDLLN